MLSDKIEAGSNKTVAWLLHGHTGLLSKKLLTQKLDKCIHECAESKNLSEENMALIEKHCPNQFKFTISIKMLKHNSPKNSIETKALCVQVKSPLREVAKEFFWNDRSTLPWRWH